MISFRPYQLMSIKHLLTHSRAALLGDMGTGKTVCTLTAILSLKNRGLLGRVLIVAPLRSVQITWPDELEKWPHLHCLRYSLIDGNPKQRVKALAKDADIYLLNYNNLPWLTEGLGLAGPPSKTKNVPSPFDMVVFDESTKIKNPSGKWFKAGVRLAGKGSRSIILTASPMPNGEHDLWSQYAVIGSHDQIGKNITAFRRRWFEPGGWMSHKWVPLPGACEDILSRVKDKTLVLRAKDYLQLPACTVNTVTVPMPSGVKAMYRSLREEMELELADCTTITAATAAQVSLKCRQFTSGAIYEDGQGTGRPWKHIHDTKLSALEDILEQTSCPVIVGYEFKHELERLKSRFPHGKHFSGPDMPALVRAWNAGKLPLAFAHPASVGHSLNLQGTRAALVWYTAPWSLELYEQLLGRIWRSGQQHPVIVHVLAMEKTVDMQVLKTLTSKDKVQVMAKDFLLTK